MGTSFSAPLISGMVTCLWQALPDKTAKEIIDIVLIFLANVYLTAIKGERTGIITVLMADLLALAGLYLAGMFYTKLQQRRHNYRCFCNRWFSWFFGTILPSGKMLC